ncbi:hypothetical protein [Aureivirga sp. CE67]|uniref:hypothetical protein n=1 Tax=Aureivirga sp. CE67 TaxID=1788983 RepID=UPI0018C9690F|nr:hypothetical protein [Aureivirga sp. CE67]
MGNILKFIDKYLCSENELLLDSYDYNVSEEQFEIKENIIYENFHHSILGNSLFCRQIDDEDDAYEVELSSKSREKIIKRTLFQIKHYQDPKMGDLLERHCKGSWLDKEFKNDPDVTTNFIDSKNIWACYVSHSEDFDKPLSYSRIYYVANTEKGLKIIDYNRFVQGKWEHQADTDVMDIINPGTLISVEKYQAPEEEMSLMDYNAE